MAINKYRPHILVLPEDDANRQLANGFLLDSSLDGRAIQVLPNAGGWMNVLDNFTKNQMEAMSSNQNRYMVLLVDFDQDADRLAKIKAVIPSSLAERVFVLGVLSEPEDLRKANLGNLEVIGKNLARDCHEKTTILWSHDLLQHNMEELQRMMPILKPILFP